MVGNPIIRRTPAFVEIASLTAAELTNRAAGFVAFVLAARALAPASFGAFALAQALVGYMVIGIDPGLSTAAITRINQAPNQTAAYARVLQWYRMLAAIVLVGTTLAVASITTATQLALFTGLSASWLVPLALNPEWRLQAASRFNQVAALRLTNSLLALVTAYFFYRDRLPGGEYAIAFFRVPGETAAALAGHWMLRRIDTDPQLSGESGPKGIRALLRQASNFWKAQFLVCSYSSGLDLLYLGWVRNASAVGWFAAGSRIYSLFGILPKLAVVRLLPVVSMLRAARCGKRLRYLFSIQLHLVLGLTLPLLLSLILHARTVLVAVFGAPYSAGAPVLAVLLCAALFQIAGALLPVLLLASERSSAAPRAYGIGLVIFVVGNLLLVPVLGELGAAIATVLVEAGVFFVCLRHCRIDTLFKANPVLRACLWIVFLSVGSTLLATGFFNTLTPAFSPIVETVRQIGLSYGLTGVAFALCWRKSIAPVLRIFRSSLHPPVSPS